MPLKPYLELTKPRLTSLVLVTTWVGYSLASPPSNPWLLFHALFGTWWVAAGAAALNQYVERDRDALMIRTQSRPLPQHRLQPWQALRFGLLISIGGVAELLAFVNPLTAFLALISLGSYVLWYTPLKTRTSLSTLVGAIPGAIPPVMGWTAATNQIDVQAWVLFGILFVWQLPHFLAIAWMYRDDYARAGFPMLPVIDPSGRMTARMIILYCVLMVPMSLLPLQVGLAGGSYLFGALMLGLAFLILGAQAAGQKTTAQARRLLLGSVVYLPSLLSWMALSR